jgi:hypothetical protein
MNAPGKAFWVGTLTPRMSIARPAELKDILSRRRVAELTEMTAGRVQRLVHLVDVFSRVIRERR